MIGHLVNRVAYDTNQAPSDPIPLTEAEEREGVDMLAPTNAQRMKLIREMLRFAVGDEMSGKDVGVCRRWFARLAAGEGGVPERGVPILVRYKEDISDYAAT